MAAAYSSLVPKHTVPALAVLALLFVAGSASSAGGRSGGASSSAFAVKVVLPGQAGTVAGEVSAPPEDVLLDRGLPVPRRRLGRLERRTRLERLRDGRLAPGRLGRGRRLGPVALRGRDPRAGGLGARASLRRADAGARRRGRQRLRRALGARHAGSRGDPEPAHRPRRLGLRAPARAGQRPDLGDGLQRLRHRARRLPHPRPRRPARGKRDSRRPGRGERPGRPSAAVPPSPTSAGRPRGRPTTCR